MTAQVWKLGAMFTSARITVLAWLHLLLLDLYQARQGLNLFNTQLCSRPITNICNPCTSDRGTSQNASYLQGGLARWAQKWGVYSTFLGLLLHVWAHWSAKPHGDEGSCEVAAEKKHYCDAIIQYGYLAEGNEPAKRCCPMTFIVLNNNCAMSTCAS